jgi:uncharacterized damage-inducible protein DinB
LLAVALPPGCLLILRAAKVNRMIALRNQELGPHRLNALAIEKGGTMTLNRWKARVWKFDGWSQEELPMKMILTQFGVCALAIALMVPLAQAQPAGLQAAFGKDAGTLSEKFSGLARVMSGKYDWKPGQGVRSVGDVFNLIVKENGMLAGVLSGTPNTGAQPAPITDPEKMQEALKASYVVLQKAITGLSDNDLQTPVKLFGRDMTKQAALMLIIEDQHEHLGQSIAYARTNGVVPPWSK